ncbi:MAG: hypothetical protein JWR62_2013, partial [Modestobacter sp.]|nr:hypothetical protein [Modestobacter sp.]
MSSPRPVASRPVAGAAERVAARPVPRPRADPAQRGSALAGPRPRSEEH